ncbi:MAG: dihydrofolate reductase [Oligoflexia bacterium]|nr:dihydrofolate reductase [Oligoflexia bacterium]
MIISLIVAMAKNRVIGIDNKLPWHLSEDLKRFRKITTGHPVVMGRKTFESIGRLLPNRENIIVTRNTDYRVLGATIVNSLEEVLEKFKNTPEEVFILGGGEIFKVALPLANKIYLTLIDKEIAGDAYFPEFDLASYTKLFEEKHVDGPLPFSFIDLARNQ